MGGASAINFTNTGNIAVEMGTSGVAPSKTLGDLNFTGIASNIKINNSFTGFHFFGAVTVADNVASFNIKSSGSNTFNKPLSMGLNVVSTFTDAPIFADIVTFKDNTNTTITGNASFAKTLTFGNNTISALNGNGTNTFTGAVKFGINTQAKWNNTIINNFNSTFDCAGTANSTGINFSGRSNFNDIATVNCSSTAGFNIVDAYFFKGVNTFNGLFKSTGIVYLFTNTGKIAFSGNQNNTFNNFQVCTSSVATFSNSANNTFTNLILLLGSYTNFNNAGNSIITTTNASGTCGAPVYINSDDTGTPKQAKVDFGSFTNKNNININNINYIGVPTPITINVIGVPNANNTNIMANVPSLGARTLYWVGGPVNNLWSECSNWSTVSGVNVGGAPAPTNIDSVVFDNNSFPSAGKTVVLDNTLGAPVCKGMTWSGATLNSYNPTFQMDNLLTVYGTTLTFANTMKINGSSKSITLVNNGDINVELGSSGTNKSFGTILFLPTVVGVRTINFDMTNGGNHTITNLTVSDQSKFNIKSTGTGNTITSLNIGNNTISNFTQGTADKYTTTTFLDNTTATINGGNTVFNGNTIFGKIRILLFLVMALLMGH